MVGRRILVGVTGGIAAFKTAELVSSLVQEGAEVRVVMTRAATRFVGAATFEALSTRPVIRDHFSEEETGASYADHIAIARWAELVVIAPATAHLIGRLAHGLADDFLTTLALATRAPVLLSPAMNTEMLEHPEVQANLGHLRERGVELLMGQPGRLACGTEGPGRMAEPDDPARSDPEAAVRVEELAGRHVLIAAGRTEEAIDPVRYISNRSSGKTGAALAAEAAARGAVVTLVWGPADVEPPPGVEVVRVKSAAQMETAVLRAFPSADVTVMAAAVADYRPRARSETKLRRGSARPAALELEHTADILAGLARHPARAGHVLIGFALEPGGTPEDARGKLERKGVDLLVWNDPTRGAGAIGDDQNEVAFLDRGGNIETLPRLPKTEIARRLFDRVVALMETAGRGASAGPTGRAR